MTDYYPITIDGEEFYSKDKLEQYLLDRLENPDPTDSITVYSTGAELNVKFHIHPMWLDAFYRVSTPTGVYEDFHHHDEAVGHVLSVLLGEV